MKHTPQKCVRSIRPTNSNTEEKEEAKEKTKPEVDDVTHTHIKRQDHLIANFSYCCFFFCISNERT